MAEIVDTSALRIVCLIPSATDICVHLGLGDAVVGITHCCDTNDLPSSVVVVTEDQVNAASTTQGDIHTKVVENPTLYPINKTLLKEISPTLIITQDLCHVCAPSSQTVFRALKEAGIDAKVVLLTPMTLYDVITNMQQVADAAGISTRGKFLCDELRSNLEELESTIAREKRNHENNATPKKVLVMEWVDPPFCGGHWIRKYGNTAV
jgi:iron complex transport system substrate-binding protein